MSKYLYGASIQGIQDFIFETNILKEIVGASNLIEWFCSERFITDYATAQNVTINTENIVRNAGGNIRIIFHNKEEVEKFVKKFPQYIMSKAYGITLSQAVVEFEDGEYLEKKDELELKLIQAKNIYSNPLDTRFAFMRHTPRTGKPAYEIKNEKLIDKGNYQKYANESDAWLNIILDKLELKDLSDKLTLNMEEISNDKNKVAVIHIDGNKMGLMLQKMNENLQNKSDKDIIDVFKNFSEQITNSTNSAVKKAFKTTFKDIESLEKIPFRPIIIGGDDVTVICSANRALEFTKSYLNEFEKETEENFSENGLSEYAPKLTACAGIAYCNEKFPFHYAVLLAEQLCSFAKEKSEREYSCLAFHNIQSSFVIDYKSFINQELTTKDEIELLFAPYYLNKEPKIETLLNLYEKFTNNEDIPLGKYREWIRELYKNKEYAELFLERIDSILRAKISEEKYQELNEELKKLHQELKLNNLIVDSKTPMQDILQLKAVMSEERQ